MLEQRFPYREVSKVVDASRRSKLGAVQRPSSFSAAQRCIQASEGGLGRGAYSILLQASMAQIDACADL